MTTEEQPEVVVSRAVSADHAVWYPEYEIAHHEVVGQEWPIITVDKFEVNVIGERRFVGSVAFSPEECAAKANP